MVGFPIEGLGVPGVLLVLAIAVFWVFQFVELMSLDDERFAGPYGRITWVAAFLVLWFLAPFAFKLWRDRTAESWTRRRGD